MKITIDELFSDIEFENLIKDNWKQQYQKYKKLPAVTKKAVVNELLKHYETVEYIKGSRSHKPCFEIGGRRDVELTQADMVEKGYYKPGSSNISNHNIIALNIFKNYLNELKLKEVETISMTRMKWLKQAGITTTIADLNEIDKLEINKDFKNYYKDDTATALKSIISFCLKQLSIDEKKATVYYCDAENDDKAETDENGNKKRLMTVTEVKAMKSFVESLKEKYNVKKFQVANVEFKNELRNWYRDHLKSEAIWVEIELDINEINVEQIELNSKEIDELRSDFMTEFQKYRNKLYVRREFKRKIKGQKGMNWRYDIQVLDLLEQRKSVIAPYLQMEERTYFKFMVECDEVVGFGQADWDEYNETDKQYRNEVKNDDVKLIEEWRQATELSSKQYEEYDDMFNTAISIA
ncbi:hypothetical protein [Pseudolactococcus raffinolactis]|uniref:hypothetical protein n=1 Tax=Pseudolactococcus raffinolactis TaxID=1366 RepID=UPI000BB4A61D|nr:hypothetical protein [Lactococcus raffinolactis]ATC60547.1 hypothetical protein CMV25_01000 [Lactococcus raffinolactis]